MIINTDDKLLKISIYDIMLIAVILLFSALSLASFRNTAIRERKAEVYLEGVFLQEIGLEEDRVIDLALYGKNMKLEVMDGGIRVIESSCPNKLCLGMGIIKSSRQTIVCVPNKVIIRIKGVTREYDAVSY